MNSEDMCYYSIQLYQRVSLQVYILHTVLDPRGGGGVLRYILSDRDVRSPFLGLKFAI